MRRVMKNDSNLLLIGEHWSFLCRELNQGKQLLCCAGLAIRDSMNGQAVERLAQPTESGLESDAFG